MILQFSGMYSNLGESFTLFDTFVYIYPMFLTVLMVSERIYCILYPFGKAFTNKKLWCYCFLIAVCFICKNSEKKVR